MQKILIKILNILSILIRKKVIYINNKYINESNLAVKTQFGFWYCGNVFNYTDIAYGFASKGSIEDDDMCLVQKILQQEGTDTKYIFYDVGCNTGPYSLLAAQSRGNICVHSFDPVKEHLEILRISCALNRFENIITTHEVALSDKTGHTLLHLSGSGSTLEKEFLGLNVPTVNVYLNTLDSYIYTNNLPPPNFLKVDVEGHEYKLLMGATDTLSKHLPILFIEVAKTLKNIGRKFTHKEFQNIFNLMYRLGYKSYMIRDNKLSEFNISQSEDGAHMFLFLHKHKHSLLTTSLLGDS